MAVYMKSTPLSRALNAKQWRTVLQQLRSNTGYTEEERCTAVDVFVNEAPGDSWRWYYERGLLNLAWWYHDIVPYCNNDQLDKVLTRALKDKFWETVGTVLHRGVSDTQHTNAVREASERAKDKDFESYILPFCNYEQLETVLTHLVTRGMWITLQKFLRESGAKRTRLIEKIVAVTDERHSVYEGVLVHCSKEDKATVLFPCCIKNRQWGLLRKMVCVSIVHALGYWTTKLPTLKSSAGKENTDDDFWQIMKHCRVQTSIAQEVSLALTQDIGSYTEELTESFSFTTYKENGQLFRLFLFILCCVICGGLTEDLQRIDDRVVVEINTLLFDDKLLTTTGITHEVPLPASEKKNLLVTLTVCPFQFAYKLPTGTRDTMLLNFLRRQRWDVISHVRSLSPDIGEQVRRDLLQAVVEKGHWNIVKQWTDHTVYNNQRWWALQEAYKHKQWQVMLLLADHGLTEIELMWVRYRLVMYADWDVVLQLFERGVDVTEVIEVVESNMKARKTLSDPAKRRALEWRWNQLMETETKFVDALYGNGGGNGADIADDSRPVDLVTMRQAKLRALIEARSGKWCLVFFHFHRHLKNHCLKEALKMAVDSQAWHMVIQLVRLLEMDTVHRDSFFKKMFNRQQWAVCRVLLDKGLSVQLCLDVLPQLMKMNLWSLVARVMEFNVDDAVRRRVLHHAMKSREGSVVWQCITTMQQYRLSAKEREKLFQQALSCGIWQAIKPLVEERDSTGILHRDTALLSAIEEHHWDVVDYCQIYHADIDMKDKWGETPLNRAAWKKDWRAVEELVVRGADPNHLDKVGHSVIARAIYSEQWGTVELLVTYLADIHHYDPLQRLTPLTALINAHQGEIIHHSLMWCADQSKGVNRRGETTLHAMALSTRPDLYYQVVRGVNPLTVTSKGHSTLMYAVQNSHCPQKMVAECIRLGFSTHQPQLTGAVVENAVKVILTDVVQYRPDYRMGIKSPFLLSILVGPSILAHMLYTSGSCSYTELYYLYHFLTHFRASSKKLRQQEPALLSATATKRYNRVLKNAKAFMPSLKEMATTPRSLMSSCRLVISHCLNVHRRYRRDVQQLYLSEANDPKLPLTDKNVRKVPLHDRLKNYLMFSDLTDPDYSCVTAPRSLASSCRLVIYDWLFYCSRGLKDGEGKNSVPCSLANIIEYYRKKRETETVDKTGHYVSQVEGPVSPGRSTLLQRPWQILQTCATPFWVE